MKVLEYLIILVLLAAAGTYFFSDKETGFLSAFIDTDAESNHADDDDDDDDDEDNVDARQQLVQGSLTVKLSPETQKLAGIKTLSAEDVTLDAEDKAYATIIDISALIDLRSRYRNVQANQKVARSQLNNAVTTLRRLEKINAETTNISTRELQEARANLEKQQALLNAEKIKLENIRAEMLQRWNKTITDMALQNNSEIFNRLISQEEYLVLLSLHPEQQLSANNAFVYINRTGDRNKARKAYLLSPAPFSQVNLRGETFFLRTKSDNLRIGMQLHVWLPGTGYSGEGIGIPDEAIVWYAGQAWAYVQIDEETFSRRSLPDSLRTRSGWLVNDNFSLGDKLVVSGAQTLLSEEFKWAIPDEDDD